MPCTSVVKVTYDKKGKPTDYELICRGDCDDKKPCKPEPEKDKANGLTRHFCACANGDEAKGCRIVLYVERKHGKIENQYFKCETADPCADSPKKEKQVCAPTAIGNKPRDDGSPEWIEFDCRCQPEDDVFPLKF